MYERVFNSCSFQDHREGEQAPGGQIVTLMEDYMADGSSYGDEQYSISLSTKVTVQQNTPHGENKTMKREKRISPTPEGDDDFNTSCGKEEENLKRRHDGIYI